MALPLLTRDAVLASITEFDAVGRDAFLERYGFGRARNYFLEHMGRQYDSKAIVGAAYGHQKGTPLGAKEFSGGESTVVPVLKALGFHVVRVDPRLPDWSTDELILALNLYLRTRGTIPHNKSAPEVVQLSQTLRALPIFDTDVRASPTFRNVAGVALKLHNFAAIDPTNAGAGMSHGSRAGREVWDTWAHRPDELHQVAQAILRSAQDERVLDATSEPEDEEGSAEGRLLYRLHRRYERNPKLAKRKKARALEETGRLTCEVCDLEPAAVYGQEFADVLDVHHVVPLHVLGESRTRLSDLAIVCPTCHRAIHRHRPFLSPTELRRRRADHAKSEGR